MPELDKGKAVSLEELMVSTLAMTDALAKLLIEKGVITSTTSNFGTAGQTAMLEYKGFKIDGSSIPMLMLR